MQQQHQVVVVFKLREPSPSGVLPESLRDLARGFTPLRLGGHSGAVYFTAVVTHSGSAAALVEMLRTHPDVEAAYIQPESAPP